MAGEGGDRLYCMHFEVSKDGAHVVPAPVLVDAIASIQRVVYLLAKFARGEDLGQRASFSQALRDAFVLQCRVPEPGSYAVPFEIGGGDTTRAAAGDAEDVGRLFRRVTAAVGRGDMDRMRALVPDIRYVDSLGRAYRKARPSSRSGVSYRIEDHRGRRIWDSGKGEASLDGLGGHSGAKRRVRADTISGMLVGMDFDERSIRLTQPDGKSVSATYDEDSERPLIEHRRGWVEVTGDVLYDAGGRALSVAHARDFVAFGEDTIELRNVNLYNVPYRASPPLRFKVKYDASDRLYDLDGDFGITVAAYSRADLHHELQEASSMLWIEYAEESPESLSPKARLLRTDLRRRLRQRSGCNIQEGRSGECAGGQGISTA